MKQSAPRERRQCNSQNLAIVKEDNKLFIAQRKETMQQSVSGENKKKTLLQLVHNNRGNVKICAW